MFFFCFFSVICAVKFGICANWNLPYLSGRIYFDLTWLKRSGEIGGGSGGRGLRVAGLPLSVRRAGVRFKSRVLVFFMPLLIDKVWHQFIVFEKYKSKQVLARENRNGTMRSKPKSIISCRTLPRLSQMIMALTWVEAETHHERVT